jgi:hypothetical protein
MDRTKPENVALILLGLSMFMSAYAEDTRPVPGLLGILAAAIAMFDFGRRGGESLAASRGARWPAAGGTLAVAILLVALGAAADLVSPWRDYLVSGALTVAGIGLAVLHGGYRVGLRQGVSPGAEQRYGRPAHLSHTGQWTYLAVLVATARSFFEAGDLTRVIASTLAALCIALAWVRDEDARRSGLPS